MSKTTLRAEFLGDAGQRIFVVAHIPDEFDGRCVLVCPPFAEEMNKTRPMLRDTAHALAARGWATVIPDLYGTGDSEGEFQAASWSRWNDDLAMVDDWIARNGWRVEALLGVRIGCALAAQFARRRIDGPLKAVLWQPVVDGGRMLEQFLRLRVAASLMSDVRETVADIKARLQSEGNVEIAGYALGARLARDLEAIRLDELFSSGLSAVNWCEVRSDVNAPLPAPSLRAIDKLRAHSNVTVTPCGGEPFWAATEIARAPELVEQAMAFLSDIES